MSEAVKHRSSEEEGIQLYLHGRAYEALKEIAEEKDIDIIDVLKDAVGLQVYVEDVRKQGGRILVERRGQPDRYLVQD